MTHDVKQDEGEGNASGWPVLDIDRQKKGGLVEQIVIAISVMVGSRALRIGTRMPSVRQFARSNGVSTFTVVESYDRLVNLGLLSSRRRITSKRR